MTNYNQQGREYIDYFSASSVVAYGTMQNQGCEFISDVRQRIVLRQRETWQPLLTRDLLKLLSRLETVFYYSSRVATYLQEIKDLPGGTGERTANVPQDEFAPPLQITRNHKELGMEFESLIFHSVAALDTLANVISDH